MGSGDVRHRPHECKDKDKFVKWRERTMGRAGGRIGRGRSKP